MTSSNTYDLVVTRADIGRKVLCHYRTPGVPPRTGVITSFNIHYIHVKLDDYPNERPFAFCHIDVEYEPE